MNVTYGQNDNYTDIYDGKMANSCQEVRGNKAKKDQNESKNKQNKTKQKQNKTKTRTTKREKGTGVEKANN